MKLKMDFVTNSSSSSFVVLGTYINRAEFVKNNLAKLQELLKDQDVGFDIASDEDIFNDLYEYVELLITKESQLVYSFGYEYDGDDIMIGMNYQDMKDDETMGEFKKRVMKELSKLGCDDKVYHIEECWMDN